MMNWGRKVIWVGVIVFSAIIVAGCKSTPSTDKVEQEVVDAVPAAPPQFIPSNFVARIKRDEGKYNTLFSLASHAVWVDKNIAEIKQAYEKANNPDISADLIDAAAEISENYIVIECHIETMFRDSSIAYDLSGLRNTTVYLQSPNGSKVYPLQQLLFTPAEEKQVGTLKQYNRTNVLVFALNDIISGMPTVPEETNTIRLYLDGFDTLFYFEWMAQEPIVLESLTSETKPVITDVIRWRPTQTETYQVLKVRFTDLYEQLAALTRIHRK